MPLPSPRPPRANILMRPSHNIVINSRLGLSTSTSILSDVLRRIIRCPTPRPPTLHAKHRHSHLRVYIQHHSPRTPMHLSRPIINSRMMPVRANRLPPRKLQKPNNQTRRLSLSNSRLLRIPPPRQSRQSTRYNFTSKSHECRNHANESTNASDESTTSVYTTSPESKCQTIPKPVAN